MLDWNSDPASVLAAIRSITSDVKIVLKTRNEELFLTKWITHHAKIFGEANLIIADSHSDSEAILDVYKKLDCTVFRFSGHMDALHDASKMPEIYRAIRDTCNYYAFIDTDEFIYAYDGTNVLSAGETKAYLVGDPDVDIYPGFWGGNFPGSARDFWCSTDPNYGTPREGLYWGKYVISSRLDIGGLICHNYQIMKHLHNTGFGNLDVRPGLFVAHLNRYCPSQRVRANVLKLLARGYAADTAGVKARALTDHDNADRYVQELRRLIPLPETAWQAPAMVQNHCVRVESGRPIQFGSGESRSAFLQIAKEFPKVAESAFRLT
jgi:hypothetical protein